MIKQLSISNYKSIKNLSLSCARINVFVGEPNVGKSNILEALDLSYLSWMFGQNASNEAAGFEKIDLKKFFRVENAAQLFYLGDVSQCIIINHDDSSQNTMISFNSKNDKNVFEWTNYISINQFNKDFVPIGSYGFYSSPIIPFKYKENIQFHDNGNYLSHLLPPFGNNLIEMLQHNTSYRNIVAELLEESGLELNLDTVERKIYLQVRIKKGLVYSIPYSSVADTFKRLFFYLAAIKYNNATVVTLEEPDAHSFPKYVSYLGDEIISTTNRQFFIATHNPYLLNNLIENSPAGDIAVFVCSKNNTGTTAKKLSSEDLSELINYGVDVFFNLNHFLDDSVEHRS